MWCLCLVREDGVEVGVRFRRLMFDTRRRLGGGLWMGIAGALQIFRLAGPRLCLGLHGSEGANGCGGSGSIRQYSTENEVMSSRALFT